MFFCKKCSNFSSSEICEFCGTKKLRKAQKGDPVFLTKKNFIYAGMLKDALKQNNIPFLCQEKNGGLLKYVGLGFGKEEYSFYVPLEFFKKANKILLLLFSPSLLRLAVNPPLFKQKKR